MAPAHPGGRRKRAVKWSWLWWPRSLNLERVTFHKSLHPPGAGHGGQGKDNFSYVLMCEVGQGKDNFSYVLMCEVGQGKDNFSYVLM